MRQALEFACVVSDQSHVQNERMGGNPHIIVANRRVCTLTLLALLRAVLPDGGINSKRRGVDWMTMGPPGISEPIPYTFSIDQYCNCRADYMVSTTYYFVKPTASSWNLMQQIVAPVGGVGGGSGSSPYGAYSGSISYSPDAENALWTEKYARWGVPP